MGRYLARRLLQAIPTVAGVVLITFVLFNVVGGSPAALVLGQNAGARSLEEFDAARGYDKPLFCGNWTKTRALAAVDFETALPGVRAAWGAGENGPLRLEDGQELAVPFAFPLPDGERWRLTVVGGGPGFPHRGKKFSTAWKNPRSARRAGPSTSGAFAWKRRRGISSTASSWITRGACCGWISARAPA